MTPSQLTLTTSGDSVSSLLNLVQQEWVERARRRTPSPPFSWYSILGSRPDEVFQCARSNRYERSRAAVWDHCRAGPGSEPKCRDDEAVSVLGPLESDGRLQRRRCSVQRHRPGVVTNDSVRIDSAPFLESLDGFLGCGPEFAVGFPG